MCVCSVAICIDTLIQQNDGSGGFNRSWDEYKIGFGQPGFNYWLGNELLHQLTADYRYNLKFELQQTYNGKWYYALYRTFRVLSEADDYTLQVSGYSSNTGNNALHNQNGMKFSTFDRDNDAMSEKNCAKDYAGGFWYNACGSCSVNARSNWNYWLGMFIGDEKLSNTRMWLECKQ